MTALTENFDLFVAGYLGSLSVILAATVASLLLGTLVAACRVSPVPPLRAFGTFWVTTFRNTPLSVVLFFCAFGLPEIGINRTFYFFGVTGLVLYTSAFVCEAVRSGINSVSPGPGRGRPLDRADLHPVAAPRRPPPGAAHRRPAAGQRDHRDVQELRRGRRVRRRR